MAIEAITFIKKMAGGSQSQLTLGSDGNFWVVKFQNNPQHVRVLANEFIATRLAAAVGLTVPKTEIIDVSSWLVAHSPDLYYELGNGGRGYYAPGMQFGSKLVGGVLPSRSLTYIPDNELDKVRNLAEFAGALAFDKWTCNCDSRQTVFARNARERKYRAYFIDQGFCFNAGEWNFPDQPTRGIYGRRRAYAPITGWESFEPWLSRIEAIQPGTLWQIAEEVPPEWCGDQHRDIQQLMEKLMSRCSRVREYIESSRKYQPEAFPNWRWPKRNCGVTSHPLSEEVAAHASLSTEAAGLLIG